MAFTKQSLTVTRPDAANQPDLVNLAIGNESFNLSVDDFRRVWKGERHPLFLVFQICIVLQQAGVNPNNATPAQIKSAIEAQTYWWGNT